MEHMGTLDEERTPLVLFGDSNILSDIYDCCNALNKRVIKIIVNTTEQKRERTKWFKDRLKELGEQPRIVSLAEFVPQEGEEYFIVPTTPKNKSALVEFLRTHGLRFTSLVHPRAYISPYASIGQGVYVGANSVIAPGAVLKDHVFVNRGVTVGHDTVINEYSRLQPGCNVGGHVTIGACVTIGLGANVIEELVIGAKAVIAAGAVVIKDVKDRTLVAGVPAVVKKVYED